MVRPLSDEELPAELLRFLKDRFGSKIPTAYRVLARFPDLLFKFVEFRDEIMKKGRVERVLKEKIALKVSEVNDCNPCYVSHKRKLEALGGREDAEDEREKVLLEFVEKAVLNRGKVDSSLEKLLRFFDEDEALEVCLVVSLYMFLNTFNNLVVKNRSFQIH
ncbi:alkylhydroperoxidase like protein, AhpD family [Ferroglobus placidus DSM 10642]|uniref:Alkylhydroperoxidase like protein, AhpD family n=1 Tax=Ferroglobus placidus (strain DSM 10642 / AEDII12DO) TaxID=589924 RepID=D3S2I1_FERPA|nr:carboxymuconolactone decarboxylase family protein [Ferroglobus placidus]ADC64511.1 alkylhydroperoxidase like protein, AhpD family [Ferroglobus placidus DSM 10642]